MRFENFEKSGLPGRASADLLSDYPGAKLYVQNVWRESEAYDIESSSVEVSFPVDGVGLSLERLVSGDQDLADHIFEEADDFIGALAVKQGVMFTVNEHRTFSAHLVAELIPAPSK